METDAMLELTSIDRKYFIEDQLDNRSVARA
jgi:hypothetical protein